jgi:hypothetical protein
MGYLWPGLSTHNDAATCIEVRLVAMNIVAFFFALEYIYSRCLLVYLNSSMPLMLLHKL